MGMSRRAHNNSRQSNRIYKKHLEAKPIELQNRLSGRYPSLVGHLVDLFALNSWVN